MSDELTIEANLEVLGELLRSAQATVERTPAPLSGADTVAIAELLLHIARRQQAEIRELQRRLDRDQREAHQRRLASIGGQPIGLTEPGA